MSICRKHLGDIIRSRCVPQSEPSSIASLHAAGSMFSSITMFFLIIMSSSCCAHSGEPARSYRKFSMPRAKYAFSQWLPQIVTT